MPRASTFAVFVSALNSVLESVYLVGPDTLGAFVRTVYTSWHSCEKVIDFFYFSLIPDKILSGLKAWDRSGNPWGE